MKNVQDIYPVSPMQEFMLLHGLSNAKSDTLFNQFVFSVKAALDPDAFERAWNQVVASHAALRTAFVWKGVETPQQVVRQSATARCETLDFTQHEEERKQAELESVLGDDRKQGFDFRRAPLTRFKLVRFAEHDWRVIWSSHHLILDRWCIDGLVADFQKHYSAVVSGVAAQVTQAPSYRNYIAWVSQQDQKTAVAHWRRYLDGFSTPTTANELFNSTVLHSAETCTSAEYSLGSDLTQRARKYSSAMSVTLGCVIQAAIAISFNRILERADIVFGATVAGRPAELPLVEDIVGSFINTLPVRSRFDSDVTVGEWLKTLNGAQFSNAEFDYLSPAQIRTCSAVGSDRPLFDVLVVWLAQTRLESKANNANEALPLVAISEQYATAYPLTLSVIEKTDELVIRADTAAGHSLPLQALLAKIKESVLQLLEASTEDTLERLSNIVVVRDRARSLSPTDAPSDADLFDVSKSAGVSTVKGREDARVDVIEDLLLGEWKAVLGLEQTVNIEDDFFELGGDSLKAAALHARVESATRKSIPLLALFETSTLQGMARTLASENWPLRAGIAMPLRLNSSQPPLFCVASPEVNTIGYAMLTRHLSEHHNVVLLQAPPESEDLQQLHPDDLTRTASDYIDALQKIQPVGPYSLLSMCSGSHIALTMVQQLEREGRSVRFMGVINTWSLYSISWRFYVNRFVNVAHYYAKRLRQVVGRTRPVVATVVATDSSKTQTVASRPMRVLPADSAVGLDNPWIKQVGLSHRMPAGLKTKVSVSVFRLDNQPFWRTGERELGWKRLAGKAHAIDLPGNDHDSILREPQVSHVASALESELEQSVSNTSALITEK